MQKNTRRRSEDGEPYEQRSSHDGAPFDRPPTLLPLDPCSERDGTSYQRSVCKKKHDSTRT